MELWEKLARAACLASGARDPDKMTPGGVPAWHYYEKAAISFLEMMRIYEVEKLIADAKRSLGASGTTIQKLFFEPENAGPEKGQLPPRFRGAADPASAQNWQGASGAAEWQAPKENKG